MPLNEAEELLALHLQELGLRFERQFAYCPGRRFKADFAVWISTELSEFPTAPVYRFALIEVQGGIFRKGKGCSVCGRTDKGAHGSVTGIKRDNARLYWAFRSGWPGVLRFTPDQVKDGTARAMIADALGHEP